MDIFPHDGMLVPSDTAVVAIFSELMDALSALKSIRVENETGVSVSLEVSGECGDDSVLLFAPVSGALQSGNYSLNFTQPLRTAQGLPRPTPPQTVRFNVSDSAPINVSGIVMDSTRTPRAIESGRSILMMPGPINITLEFSVDIDLVEFIKVLQNQGREEKPRECESRVIGLSFSLNIGTGISFTLTTSGVIDRQNQSRRLPTPFFVIIGALSSSVSGKVTDLEGGIIGGATVTLASQATNMVKTMAAGPSGNFTFVDVVPGNYVVCAEQSWFNKSCQSVAVAPGPNQLGVILLSPLVDSRLVLIIITIIAVIAIVGAIWYRRTHPPPPAGGNPQF